MTVISANPAGETKIPPQFPSGTWPLDTPGGRFYAEWDDQAPVTREGHLIFFFQFLQAGGRWEEFLRDCPLHCTGNRGSGALNVMGTVLLSVLSGHWRYAHFNALRGDGINPGLLGMSGTVSEDAVRLAMGRIDEATGLNWLSNQILGSISPALGLHHREAIRPRPMLMSGVGRQVQSGGRRTVKASVLHEKGELIAQAVTRISNELHRIRAITERWTVEQRGRCC